MIRLQSPKTAQHLLDLTAASASPNLQNILVVIDANVDNYQQLVAGLIPGVNVLVLLPTQDGIEQITQALKVYSNITTIQIIAHGTAACLNLGNTQLSLNTIERYTWDLTSWFSTPQPRPASLLLYACEVAAGEVGMAFLQKLRHLTEAEIAASTTPIGSAELGGSWELDVKTGAIECKPIFQPGILESYPNILNNAYHRLSTGAFAHNWLNTGLITSDDDWSNVPSIIGYRGDDLVASSGSDPQTVVTDGTLTPIDVNANQNSPNSFTSGGITEFTIATNPTIAMQGSGTADAPFLLLHLDTTGASGIQIAYNLRDLDSTSDDAVSQVALQYRVGETGDFINLPDGYVADASTGSTANLVTPVKVTLPDTADNQSKVQIRIIITNADGNDEWIGVDDIFVAPTRVNQAPILTGNATLTPINEDSENATNMGNKISDFINGLSTDADFDPQAIAVVGADNSNGTWQYSTNGGATWLDFGNAISESNAVVLGATSLYSASLGTAPADQGWLAFANIAGATQTTSTNGTLLDTTLNSSIYAGYSNFNGATLVNPNFPLLNNGAGYSISFNLQMLAEARTNQSRAGFSIIAISEDATKAIELGFQQLSAATGQIFAQDPSFNSAEFVSYNTNIETSYTLKVEGDGYKLFADGTEVLAGALRDYTGFVGPIDPYETPNFIFLGDDTTSAQGWFNLSQVTLQTETRVRFLPNPDYNGGANINFRAWDTTNGLTNGATGVNASVNGGATAYSANVSTVAIAVNSVNDAPTGIVTINGVAQENQTLTVNSANLIDVDGLGAFGYQWQSGDGTNWTDIATATNSTFTPDALQVGQIVRVKLTYTDQDGTVETIESAPTETITSRPLPNTPPDETPETPAPNTPPNETPTPSTPLVLTLDTDTGVSSNDGITNTNQPRFQGQAQPGSAIQLFAGQSLLGTTTADATGNWIFAASAPLADGNYEIFLTSTSPSGSITSSKFNLTIDTTLGNASIITTGNTIRETSTETITIRFSEVVSNFDLSDLSLLHNGRSVSLAGATLTTADNITWTLGNLYSLTTDDGYYEVTLRQNDITDLAGNRFVAAVEEAWLLGRTAGALPQAMFKNNKPLGIRRTGGRGDDRLIGTPLNDVLKGSSGDDRIISGFGQAQFGVDRLDGGNGNDNLISGKGNDILEGGKGNDWINAGKGNDLLQGGDGNDRLMGKAGQDVLVGGAGRDRLTGGKDQDTFVFNNLFDGIDTITDFEAGDLLNLRLIFAQPEFSGSNAFARFVEFVNLEQVGADVKVSIDVDGKGAENNFSTLAILQNTTLEQISARDFLIA